MSFPQVNKFCVDFSHDDKTRLWIFEQTSKMNNQVCDTNHRLKCIKVHTRKPCRQFRLFFNELQCILLFCTKNHDFL